MHLPHLPAPLAQRPEPGAQLLEAVQQRQAERSLRLAQQWVHRRGVVDLQRFCSNELNSALGQEAVLWLQGLLEFDDPLSRAQQAEPQRAAPLSSTSDDTPEADPGVVLEASFGTQASQPHTRTEPSSGAPLRAVASPVVDSEAREQDLQARAVAAVDEPFAALAQTFRDEPRSAAVPAQPAEPTPAPLSFAIEAAATRTSGPQPLPVRVGLWPSLRASAASLGAALRPSSGGGRTAPLGADQDNQAAMGLQAKAELAQPTAIPGPISAAQSAKEPSAEAAVEPAAPLRTPTATRPEPDVEAKAEADAEAKTGDRLRPEGATTQSGTAQSDTAESVALESTAPESSAAVVSAAESATGESGTSESVAVESSDAPVCDSELPTADGAAALPSEPSERASDQASDPDVQDGAVPEPLPPRAGLLQRLSGRIRRQRLPRLTRLRAVMRDCFEETVALLRTPEPEFDDDDFDAEPLLEPLPPLASHELQPPPPPLAASEPKQPPQPLPVRAPARLSWSLDPSVQPSRRAAADSSDATDAPSWPAPASVAHSTATPTANTADDPAAIPAEAPGETPVVPAGISPLRPSLIGSQPEGRPSDESPRPAPARNAPAAPAPASLSDLRAWLPDRRDLPKAS